MKLRYTYIMGSILNDFRNATKLPSFTVPMALKFSSFTPNSNMRYQNEPKTENVPKLIRQ